MMFIPVESSTLDGFTLTGSQNKDCINEVVVVVVVVVVVDYKIYMEVLSIKYWMAREVCNEKVINLLAPEFYI